MNSFEEDLKKAVDYHGHLCAGQILGVRIARLGLKLLNIENAETERDLIVYVEADRCIADAVGVISNRKMGRRSLKWVDFGKTAATFVNIRDNKAIRIASNGKYFAKPGDDVTKFFEAIPDEELFKIEWVNVDIKKEDLPGKPSVIEFCDMCKEAVMDNRHVEQNGKILCRSCAGNSYYTVK